MSTPALRVKSPLVIFYDLETTGLNHTKDEILEIACRVDPNWPGDRGQRVDTFCRFIRPVAKEIPAAATAIHGITFDMVAKQRSAKHVEKRLTRWLHTWEEVATPLILVAHNNFQFDRSFFRRTFPRLREAAFVKHGDSLWAFERELGIKKGELALQKLGKRFHCLAEGERQSHRAMGDVELLIAVVQKLSVEEKKKFYEGLVRCAS
jgi:DNA polymerase III alpha subunit (gram-positive type)